MNPGDYTPAEREVILDVGRGVLPRAGDDDLLEDLAARGLVMGSSLNTNRPRLTERGKELHEAIRATGDGPEALKEAFKPLTYPERG